MSSPLAVIKSRNHWQYCARASRGHVLSVHALTLFCMDANEGAPYVLSEWIRTTCLLLRQSANRLSWTLRYAIGNVHYPILW